MRCSQAGPNGAAVGSWCGWSRAAQGDLCSYFTLQAKPEAGIKNPSGDQGVPWEVTPRISSPEARPGLHLNFLQRLKKKEFQVTPLFFFFHPFFSFSIRSVMQKYLEERGELTFDKIFHQKIGKSCLNKMLLTWIFSRGVWFLHFSVMPAEKSVL